MSDNKAATKGIMAASESLLQCQLVRNSNTSTTSPVGAVSSAAPGSTELSDTQFNASLDALMSGDNWLGMNYSQMASNSSTGAVEYSASNPLVQSGARLEASMNSFVGQLNKQNLPGNHHSTISNPSTAVDVGSYATLFPGQSFARFGGGPGAMSPASVPPTPSFPSMVAFAPIQPLSSSDYQFKPPASKRRRAGGTVDSASISAVSEDEGGGRSRRRNDRNQREQQRSQQIAQQISYLRDMLSAANVQFKPDKFSTLVTVGDFIKSLQERVELLDCEHKKLLSTIMQTTNAVNSQFLPPGGNGTSSESMKVDDFFDDGKVSPLQDDDCPPFVSSLDYKAVFDCCPVASAITSIDGRFLDCNHDFEELTGFSKSELVCNLTDETSVGDFGGRKTPGRSMSLFNTVRREHMEAIFLAMSDMLKVPFTDFQAVESSAEEYRDADMWSGVVTLVRKDGAKVNLGVSLVRDKEGRPKCFNCTMIPIEAPMTSSAAVG